MKNNGDKNPVVDFPTATKSPKKLRKIHYGEKIIGFDLDGVIIDHVSNKIKLAKKFNLNLDKKQTPSEILRTLMTEIQFRELQNMLYDDPKISLSAPLMRGVADVLLKIKNKNIPFFLISRRKNKNIPIKLLAKHGLWPKYFNQKNSYFVKKTADKEIQSKILGTSHYFDDNSKVLEALVSVKNKFLFDYLEVFKNSKFKRVTSWKEIFKLI
ncbi:MAG: hypothetical protein COV30_00715 [Candidatus Yanofskybacteria bacterium CG10_big_fil_rev_8_21_14_0_10_37_15]|uniref:FCP1 homology domain-containing protein n=1 Tax=Candidatus Yanofskybacteria bacterium CG10_big_fil_rev_8_21_14_0_10_37_15 TaxID=1975097 RepID=A0A2H0R881_9BACT|nr:MAG: hypothetical protein COV30_00715 [Candidatus Yanofskybacteria bacterium CG10_big_fil_rev_8_21_14_0_10_37_15]